MNKKQLRARFLSRRKKLTPAFRRSASLRISGRFRKQMLPLIGRGSIVLAYIPHSGEVDTLMILEMLRAKGAKLYVPCVINGRIVPCLLRRGAGLVRRAFGILEPAQRHALPRGRHIDAIITPGVAFDRSGNRLGFGGGYYDRFLGSTKNKPLKAALCYGMQLAQRIPAGNKDVRMDLIITEKEVIACGKKARP